MRIHTILRRRRVVFAEVGSDLLAMTAVSLKTFRPLLARHRAGELTIKKVGLFQFRFKLGDCEIDVKNLVIEVKSKQNFKSEWEPAMFRARLEARV